MALVNCPECGKAISTNAEYCVHCGSRFCVCPDCSKVLTGSPSVCPNCGFLLNDSSRNPKEKNNLDQKIVCEFENYVNADKKNLRISNILELAAWIICGIFIFVAILGVVNWLKEWKNADAIERLDILITYKKDYESIKMWLILSCIAFILACVCISTVKKVFLKILCSTKLKCLHTDTNQLLSMIGNMRYRDDNALDDFMRILECCYFLSDPEMKRRALLIAVLKSIFYGLSTIFATICIETNLSAYFQSIIAETNFQFQYTWLIVTGVVIIVSFIVMSIVESRYTKKFSAWTDKVLE